MTQNYYVQNFETLHSTRIQNEVYNGLHQIDRAENEVSFRKVQPGASKSGSRRRLAGQKPRVNETEKGKTVRRYNRLYHEAQTWSAYISDLECWTKTFHSGYENYDLLLVTDRDFLSDQKQRISYFLLDFPEYCCFREAGISRFFRDYCHCLIFSNFYNF